MSTALTIRSGVPVTTRARLSRIVDASGAAIPLARVYESAGTGRRFRGLDAPLTGPNSGTGDIERLRARARALDRNDPRVRRALNALVANLVGTGIKPQSALPNPTLRKALHALWFDSVDELDADGVTDFYGFEARVVRAMIRDGECFVRLRPRRVEDGLLVPLQLQLLEADHCPVGYTLSRGRNQVVDGIEFDAIGRRVAYHMTRQHPADPSLLGRLDGLLPVPIPAEEIIHVYLVERPGQIRGVSWFAPVILRAHNMDLYDDAQMWRQNLATAFVGVWEQPGGLEDDTDLEDDGSATAPTLEHGTIIRGLPGEKFVTTSPPSMGQDYDSFKRWTAREFASGVGLTYAQQTGDHSDSTYSADRSGVLEFRRWAEPLIHAFAYQFCRPVWRTWLDTAVAAGALALPGYRTQRRAYQRVRWIPQGWPWVDPQKDLNAKLAAISAGLTSPQEVIAEMGNDPEQVLDDLAAWKAALAARDLTPADLRGMAGQQVQAAPQPAEADEPAPSRRRDAA